MLYWSGELNNNHTHTNNNMDGEDLLERTRIILENEIIMDEEELEKWKLALEAIEALAAFRRERR